MHATLLIPVGPSGRTLAEWALAPLGANRVDFEETAMGKGGRKRRSRRKSAANHGKRPNA